MMNVCLRLDIRRTDKGNNFYSNPQRAGHPLDTLQGIGKKKLESNG